MILTDGDKYDGIYEGDIPPQQNNTIVWYYIEACDFVGNKRISDYSLYKVFFSDKSWLSIGIQIAEIDIKDLSATLILEFKAQLPSSSEREYWVNAYNARQDGIFIDIGAFRLNKSKTPERFEYENKSTWKVHLLGNPNSFPYDLYTLNLTFTINWSKIDYLKIEHVFFSDYRLLNVWEDLKILNQGANYTSESPEVFVDIRLTRNTDDRLPVILPILALFFMLGATLFF